MKSSAFYPAYGRSPAKTVQVTIDPVWKLRGDIAKASELANKLEAKGDRKGAEFWRHTARELAFDLTRRSLTGSVQ